MLRSYAARKFLPARRVFRTGRDAKPGVENVFLVLEQNGTLGYGEASPNRYFVESVEDVQLRLLGLADFLKQQTLRSFEDVARIWSEAKDILFPSKAAMCAVDLALWDLWGKLLQNSSCDIAGFGVAKSLKSAVTLSVSHAEDLNARISEVSTYPLIKVKMDSSADLTPLKKLRAAGAKRLLVDANASWSPEQCLRLLPELEKQGVEAVEQPLPPAMDAEMEKILPASPLPLIADESCVTPEDVERMAGRFSGINIKLVKCGGLTPALTMLETARRLQLKVMTGCMLESSLLISAGAIVAQKADWVDLDGSWLLAEDPFQGPVFECGVLTPISNPGLGVALRDKPDIL
jgi:L-alanine-DL-glutamate epimerase-like enolase superfamily enzyme